MKKIKSLYIDNRFFQGILFLVACFIISFIADRYILVPKALFVLFVGRVASQPSSNELLVELDPIEVDPKHPSRNSFGELTLLSGFHLQSKDKRFGGLSGLSIGRNGLMYAISDRGYWLTARMVTNENGALTNLVDWRIAPLLTSANAAVSGRLRDAEALAQTRDGSSWLLLKASIGFGATARHRRRSHLRPSRSRLRRLSRVPPATAGSKD